MARKGKRYSKAVDGLDHNKLYSAAEAVKMVKDNPDIGAVVLECTEFPPYAHAIQDAIRLNVWDFVTMTNFMHAGAMRKPFTGWM